MYYLLYFYKGIVIGSLSLLQSDSMPIVVATSLNRVLNLLLYRFNIKASFNYRVRELSSSSKLELVVEYYRSNAELVVVQLAYSLYIQEPLEVQKSIILSLIAIISALIVSYNKAKSVLDGYIKKLFFQLIIRSVSSNQSYLSTILYLVKAPIQKSQ